VERVDARTARWLGPLKPLLRTYEVQVTYRAPVIIELIDALVGSGQAPISVRRPAWACLFVPMPTSTTV
jgi:hypothetical protein